MAPTVPLTVDLFAAEPPPSEPAAANPRRRTAPAAGPLLAKLPPPGLPPTGAPSAGAPSADVSSADVSSADVSSADVSSADVSSADVSSAGARSAGARSAGAPSADVSSAGVSSADVPQPADPVQLHPALWRAHQLGGPQGGAVASGFAALDAELPGGGWPARALTELLLPHAGVGELRLLAPALAAVQRGGRSLIWFDPPALPCGWTLAALGLDLRQLVVVRPRPRVAAPQRTPPPPLGADVLWALEQALRSGHVGAVLAWLPPGGVPAQALRRLQLAAQAHEGPAFLLREAAALVRPSVAPLRLLLAPAAPDALALRILKRRGPPCATVLQLALAPSLSAPVRARAERVAPWAAQKGPAGQAAHAEQAAPPARSGPTAAGAASARPT